MGSKKNDVRGKEETNKERGTSLTEHFKENLNILEERGRTKKI